MNWWTAAAAVWLGWPQFVQIVLLLFAALLIAQQLNRAIARFAFHRRRPDPWLPAPEGMPPRTLLDRCPLIGWWRLRREAPRFGRGFWLRPLFIELLFPVGVVMLHHWELMGGLYPASAPLPAPATLLAQFVAHTTLIALMVVATFIDFDEQTIPDEIALVGTAIGVALLCVLPICALPTIVSLAYVPSPYHVVVTTANHHQNWLTGLGGPYSWPPSLNEPWACATALACLLAWWLAVLPKVWTLRKGPFHACRLAIASVIRYRTWKLPSLLAMLMAVFVVVAYLRGEWFWQAAFSSVIGAVAAAGFTWLVRIVASRAMGMEALGFGDVTLMGMIGAFLGWQASLLVFFFAPLTAVVIAVGQWLMTRRHDIAFGPYLCLSAGMLIVGWRRAWFEWAMPAFSMGWMMPAIVLIAVVMLGVLLTAWQALKQLGR